ncbi:MAG: protein kinase [Gemmatimonadetes bacterium]|nr:protein kinase [Gemmatimonadota bacterium]
MIAEPLLAAIPLNDTPRDTHQDAHRDVRSQLQTALGAAYVIERELGGGGMSRVFLAEETRLGRKVVVKLLSPELAAGVSADRFEREIRLAARLQHPHIVPLLAAGDVNGLPYYTMPFVAGASLRDRLQAAPIPTAEAQGILRDVAKALAYAHRQGIVHRDIKPENVLLNDGTAMVADFGVARAISAAATLAGNGTITQAGVQVGTPAYMAPEQAAGDPDVDFRADLYAFGVMAYELLAGQHPFAQRRTAHALVIAHMTETPVALTTHSTTVAPSMASIVMQCLGKDPLERPESASALVAALEAAAITPVALPVVTTPAPASSATIAVLPFANMSGDPDNEYFSDGITDDIISALTQVPGLRVAARASAFSYKGRNEDLATIGRTLGVTTVLQGSVRRAGNKVRVTAQLMNTHDGFQLWSERFDRSLDDIFAIQDEIARSIVDHLELTLGLRESKSLVARPTEDLEAYELYLRGREAVHQRTPPSMRRGLEFFEQAIARDPNYARAHLGRAEAYIGLGVYQAMPTLEAGAKAEEAIARVVSLNPDLAAIHVLRGQLKLYLRSDWPTAGVHLEESLRRDPNDALANVYMGLLNGMLGRREERSRWAARAIQRDPLSPFVRGIAGMCHFVSGDYEEALRLYDEGLAMDPNFVLCLWQSGLTLDRLGRYEEELTRFERAVDLSRRGVMMVSFLYRAFHRLGRTEDARALLDEIIARSANEYIAESFWLSPAMLGTDPDAKEASLRLNIEARTGPTTLGVSVGAELADLLDDPRLGPLVRQLTLYAERPT